MRYNRLGHSGLYVSELCLGAMSFGRASEPWWSGPGRLDQPDADRVIGRAVGAGINFIDTADAYVRGKSEEIVGQGLRNLGIPRDGVVLATKVYMEMGPGPNQRGASRGHIMDGVAASLKRLQTDYIDLYQIHAFDAVTPMEETLRALDDVVSRGMVRYIGCSNWQAWQLMKAIGIAEHHGWVRPETVQAYYSLAGRDLEREILPLMRDQALGLLVWSPLAAGLLSGKYGPGGKDELIRRGMDFPPVDRERAWACIAVLREIAEARGVSVARVALAWLLAQPHVTSIIIGISRLEQLDDNLGAVTLALSADELARLDAASALPPEYPGWTTGDFFTVRRPPAVEPDR